MRNVALGAIGGCLILAGCAGPRIATTAVAPIAAPAQWRTEAGTGAPLDREWWRSFGDPVLAGLVEQALANNTDIAISAARVREARANQRLAQSQLLPTFDASAGGGESRTINAFGKPLDQTFLQPQAQVAYEADLFGRLADGVSAARSAYLASEAAHDAARLSVAGATASQYIMLLGLDARLTIARQTLEARRESLRIAQSRDRAGYSPRLELQQARAEYDATAQIVPQIETAIARTEDSLRLLVGEVPGPVARGQAFAQLTVPPVPDTLPSQLVDRRPDIAQAANQLAAADSALAAARKRFLPQVRLSGSAGVAFSSVLADPITLFSIGGSVLAPLFEGGRLTAQAQVSASQRDQAAFAYRRAVLTAFRDVEDALATSRNLAAQVTLARHQRDTLAEALRLATNRYREGYSPYLEQLDAQRGLLNAQLALVALEVDALTARVQLYQAMGGGWTPEDLGRATP
jgi:NodT family efflux transporter outer membrane factor (OMF) lipoprotein